MICSKRQFNPLKSKNCENEMFIVLLCYQTVLEQGGIQPGGLNFDCKVRRESTDLKDMFISHIGTTHNR